MQIQILNKFDSCCFWGARHRSYIHDVRRIANEVGSGTFGVLIDNSTYREHGITPWAINQILSLVR